MNKIIKVPESLTEAQVCGGNTVRFIGGYSTQSNSRDVSYAELYRDQNRIMDTPAQYLQEVIEEEKERKKKGLSK